MVVSNQVKSSRKDGVSQKPVFKTNRPYRVLEKDTPRSYWLQSLPFCESLGRPENKLKESVTRMEKIPSAMVLHNHVDGSETIFYTMLGPLVNNTM